MKWEHEQWVRDSLQDYNDRKQRDAEVYATYIDEWAKRVELDEWTAWSSNFMSSGQPSIQSEKERSLAETARWTFGRVWPGRYPELEASFDNFCRVLNDLLQVFRSNMEERGERLWTRKIYQNAWGAERDRLHRQFEFHVDLVEDLMLELTRAANFVCDRVREFLDPTFRIDEGLVMAQSGPYVIDEWHLHRVRYRGDERVAEPYPGLARFKVERKERDKNFGEGTSIDDPNCKIAGY